MSASLEQIIPYLRPLATLLLDATVTDVLVNDGGRRVFAERKGRLEPVAITLDSTYLRAALEVIAHMCAKDIDQARPMLDARLDDGSRIAATVPPCASDGDTLTIRKFTRRYTLDELVGVGTLSNDTSEHLRTAVRQQRNLLISGGTGTGKTTLLNAVAQTIPLGDRVIVIEDTSEIFIPSTHHVVRFEAQPELPAVPGEAAVPAFTIGALLRHTLRNRPDRIIVGEVRDGAGWDLLQALNTGHQGSMTTIHANSATLALTRLRDCVLQSGINLHSSIILESIGQAIHVVVHLERDRETGQRAVTEVLAVTGYDGPPMDRFRTARLYPTEAA